MKYKAEIGINVAGVIVQIAFLIWGIMQVLAGHPPLLVCFAGPWLLFHAYRVVKFVRLGLRNG